MRSKFYKAAPQSIRPHTFPTTTRRPQLLWSLLGYSWNLAMRCLLSPQEGLPVPSPVRESQNWKPVRTQLETMNILLLSDISNYEIIYNYEIICLSVYSICFKFHDSRDLFFINPNSSYSARYWAPSSYSMNIQWKLQWIDGFLAPFFLKRFESIFLSATSSRPLSSWAKENSDGWKQHCRRACQQTIRSWLHVTILTK